MSPLRRLTLGGGLFFLLFAFGAARHMLIEGWSFWDALFMTAITVTTVRQTL